MSEDSPERVPELLFPPSGSEWISSDIWLDVVGRKARGLSIFPAAWQPPFVVLTSATFDWWRNDARGREETLQRAADMIERTARRWRQRWPRGLILRSSASTETLEDRGTHETRRLAGDFRNSQIADALERIFEAFLLQGHSGRLAIIAQALANEGSLGHLSNERRVSKTVNQWRWERIFPDSDWGRLNSQRDRVPDEAKSLTGTRPQLVRMFGAVGRWITLLNRGPAHVEWAYDGVCLWLLQLDFEHERPDGGVDPHQWFRDTDYEPSGVLPPNSLFSPVILGATAGPWRKIENLRQFLVDRSDPYPALISITGDRLLEYLAVKRGELKSELDSFAHGRLVCRTDCRTQGVSRENLPRTHTVSSSIALDEMVRFLEALGETGAPPSDVCFIAHKFIPARAGAWVKADPGSQIVVVDSLWGVPDGLQYLPHDTFQYDIRLRTITAERLRYKPYFIQEGEDGTWQELRVRRSLARGRSLSAADVALIAETSHRIAARAERPILIMWFCGVPAHLGIGRNLPWFSMPAVVAPQLSTRVSPRWPRVTLRNAEDVEHAQSSDVSKSILVLEPELHFFRDDKRFLSEVINLAKKSGCPVQISGSTLAHAYYQLEKEGIAVVPLDDAGRSRARNRRSFDKLVRDGIPNHIAHRGELVVQSRLPRSELRHALVAKLLEEAQELLDATDPDDVKAELADLLEVVRGLASVTGVKWLEVESQAEEKRSRRGGFEAGAVLVETASPTPDRTTQRVPSLVNLRKLARVKVEEQRISISFNALLAGWREGVEFQVQGRRFGVRLTRDGIIIDTSPNEKQTTEQLPLPL